jgi:hypothetical protein
MGIKDELTLEQIAALTNVMRVRANLEVAERELDRQQEVMTHLEKAADWLVKESGTPEEHRPHISDAMMTYGAIVDGLITVLKYEVQETKRILVEKEIEASLLSDEPDE